MPVPSKTAPEPSVQVDAAPDALLAMGRNPSASQLGQRSYLQMPPGPGALLRHHPANWEVAEVDGVPYWLPEISSQPKVAGTPGVRVLQAGEDPEAAWQTAVFNGQRKGWVYLDLTRPVPVHCLPNGVAFGALPFREYDCRDPKTGQIGTCQVEVWKLPRPSLPEERQRFWFDRAAYNRWRLYLVESGAIRPPLPHVVEAKTAKAAERVHNVGTAMASEVRARLLAPREAVAKQHAEAKIPALKGAA